MDAKNIADWGEVRALVFESYRLIAPKRTLAKLDDSSLPTPTGRKKPVTKKKTVAKKSTKKSKSKVSKSKRR